MNKLAGIKSYIIRKKRLLLLVGFLLIAGLLAFLFTRSNELAVDITNPGKRYYSQLTGNAVSKAESGQPILAVMLENSEEARPQVGLDAAGIVFETVTEAGITRYLALYQEDMPDEVGPVRSVRPYFVDWLMGFDASVAHVGGSQQALDMIDDRDAKSLNEFYNQGPYYRSDTREAPHNVFARMKDLVALQRKRGHNKADIPEIPREDDAPSPEPNAANITIDFSEQIFQVRFQYDKSSNRYTRYLAGSVHIDAATNKPITVKNLVVLKMPGDVSSIGEGDAQLFRNGMVQTVRWRKTSYDKRLELLDTGGKNVSLNRGDTWIAVVPGSGSVSY